MKQRFTCKILVTWAIMNVIERIAPIKLLYYSVSVRTSCSFQLIGRKKLEELNLIHLCRQCGTNSCSWHRYITSVRTKRYSLLFRALLMISADILRLSYIPWSMSFIQCSPLSPTFVGGCADCKVKCCIECGLRFWVQPSFHNRNTTMKYFWKHLWHTCSHCASNLLTNYISCFCTREFFWTFWALIWSFILY